MLNLFQHPPGGKGELPWFERFEAELFRQVEPAWIVPFNKIEFPVPSPVFELLLVGYRGQHILEELEIDEFLHRMPGGESGDIAAAVLVYPAHQIGRYADIDRAICIAGKDIDARLAVHALPISLPGHGVDAETSSA